VLPSATIAKLQNKLTTAQLAEAQRLIKNGNGIHKQADARLAIELLAEALEIIAAKPAATAAPAPAKATTAPNPAAPAVSKTPLADQLAKLDGIERTEFFNANSRALRIEGMKAAVPGTITPAK